MEHSSLLFENMKFCSICRGALPLDYEDELCPACKEISCLPCTVPTAEFPLRSDIFARNVIGNRIIWRGRDLQLFRRILQRTTRCVTWRKAILPSSSKVLKIQATGEYRSVQNSNLR